MPTRILLEYKGGQKHKFLDNLILHICPTRIQLIPAPLDHSMQQAIDAIKVQSWAQAHTGLNKLFRLESVKDSNESTILTSKTNRKLSYINLTSAKFFYIKRSFLKLFFFSDRKLRAIFDLWSKLCYSLNAQPQIQILNRLQTLTNRPICYRYIFGGETSLSARVR